MFSQHFSQKKKRIANSKFTYPVDIDFNNPEGHKKPAKKPTNPEKRCQPQWIYFLTATRNIVDKV